MIKLDLAYLQTSIRDSEYDYCEAGSVKSVNRNKHNGLGTNARKGFGENEPNESHMAFSSLVQPLAPPNLVRT